MKMKKCELCSEPFPVPYHILEAAVRGYLDDYGLLEPDEEVMGVDFGLPIDEDDCVEVDLIFDVGGC